MNITKNEKLIQTLIDKMFEIAGHSVRYKDVIGRKDEWFTEYTITQEQEKEWMEWGAKYLAKNTWMNLKRARLEMAMVNMYCGLRVEDLEVKA